MQIGYHSIEHIGLRMLTCLELLGSMYVILLSPLSMFCYVYLSVED